ncbi:MAG: hypothetical protein HFF19_10135 [Oscillospiraceae bacterium]|jgi:hypothetical protein|nr:hypothetical protein [Oscillospiraceae bacterium]
MTNEEAIDVFEGLGEVEAISLFYQRGGKADGLSIHRIKEACRMAITTLRAQQVPAKLDRSRWEGCEYCKPDREGYSTCFQDKSGHSIRMYIPEGEAAIVIPGKYNHKSYIKISYCPICGRPLTEAAWTELEGRISDGTAN